MDETVNILLQYYDEMELENSVPPHSGAELSAMEDDETTALSDSFSNTLTLEDTSASKQNDEKEKELQQQFSDQDASRFLSFLLDTPEQNLSSSALEENVLFFLPSFENTYELLLQSVGETTRQYHKLRAELNWLQRRKGKVERKLAERQIKKLRDGQTTNTRKRILVTSDDPVTALEKKQILFEQRLLETRKELMKVVKELVCLKSQQPSLKLSGLIKEGQGECSRVQGEDEAVQLRQPSSRGSKKKKEEVSYAYPGTILENLKGTTNMEALIEEIKAMIGEDEIKIEELEFFGSMIGKGAYGEVYTAKWREAVVAVKQFPLTVREHKRYVLKSFQRELECLQQARDNPRIVKFYGACLLEDCCYIVMEYMEGGSLYNLLFKQGFYLSMSDSLKIALEVAQGIYMLHKHKPEIVHRDLNVSNLLIRNAPSIWEAGSLEADGVLIADFSPAGHPRYRAPELFDADAVYTKKADVYSFGMLLYELLERKPIYEGFEDKEVNEKISNGEYPTVSADMPASLYRLILSCWKINPKKRPSFKTICRKLKKQTLRSAQDDGKSERIAP